MSEYDVAVIGSGPGGYVCAIRAVQLGKKVVIIEKESTLGGTCLNVGCIPSKALLQVSEEYHELAPRATRFGFQFSDLKFDLAQAMKHKEQVVDDNVNGISFLMKKNAIDVVHGFGKLAGANQVTVTGAEGETTITAASIVIASGSVSSGLPGVEVDKKRVITSTEALTLSEVPKSMIIIGAGVIGLEMGSVWSRLGAEVTVIEYLDRILPGIDKDIAKRAQSMLTKQGFEFVLNAAVSSATSDGDSATIEYEPKAGGDKVSRSADVVLLAAGRSPYTDGLGLDERSIEKDKRGFIVVNDSFQTSVSSVYAIGDAVRGPMLAHKAEEDGVAVAQIIAGKYGHVDYNLVPGVVYCSPEIATIGKSEDSLKVDSVAYKVGKFNFSANGRARAIARPDGLVKILADAETDEILGASIIGFAAGDLIHEIAVTMAFRGSAEDLASVCFAHPTLSEAVKEAALSVSGSTLHS